MKKESKDGSRTKRLTTRQQNALITKKTIYDTAISLFLKNGYENVKIEEITRAANVAKGTFYIYFESKKELLYHTFDELDKVYEVAYEKIDHSAPFGEQIVTFLTTAYESHNHMVKELARALYHNSVLEKDPKLLSPSRTMFKLIKEIVKAGLAAGELNDQYDADFYLGLIRTQIAGIDYCWIVSSDDLNFSDFTQKNIYALTQGLLNI
ncbi:TetR/AcrR family transcriptional regulator [Bacilliculturomica massiliensis]|uniref:TetR/AcrR family transcriptional regulator n=1 Tax=Bacilliculturomica massiliensis TaxID=1917867 RepID=UPI001030AEDC|nr:TetR/AcrR family transcriptional regulator [Bacilliculturomica massiliensis]